MTHCISREEFMSKLGERSAVLSAELQALADALNNCAAGSGTHTALLRVYDEKQARWLEVRHLERTL